MRNQQTLAYHFQAAARAFEGWAGPAYLQEHEKRLAQKLPHLRKAVRIGVGRGGQRKVPPELVRAEWLVIKEALNGLPRSKALGGKVDRHVLAIRRRHPSFTLSDGSKM